MWSPVVFGGNPKFLSAKPEVEFILTIALMEKYL